MENKWKEIWEKRNANSEILHSGDKRKIFLELKRISGWDSMSDTAEEGIDFAGFYEQYLQIKNELEFSAYDKMHTINSVFEVGCGSGANLYLFQNDGLKVGGGRLFKSRNRNSTYNVGRYRRINLR